MHFVGLHELLKELVDLRLTVCYRFNLQKLKLKKTQNNLLFNSIIISRG